MIRRPRHNSTLRLTHTPTVADPCCCQSKRLLLTTSVVAPVVIYFMTASPVSSGCGSVWWQEERAEEPHKKNDGGRDGLCPWVLTLVLWGENVEQHKAVHPNGGKCPHLGRKICLTLGLKNGVCVCLWYNLKKLLRHWAFCDAINLNAGQNVTLGLWLKYRNTTQALDEHCGVYRCYSCLLPFLSGFHLSYYNKTMTQLHIIWGYFIQNRWVKMEITAISGSLWRGKEGTKHCVSSESWNSQQLQS